jgi:amino acid transporter
VTPSDVRLPGARAGALCDYVTDGLGQQVGAMSGFVHYPGVLALGGGLLVLIAGTIHDTLAAEFNRTGIPILGWSLILLVLIGAIMYLGVALSTRAQLVLALLPSRPCCCSRCT